jgi:hypothetical protein
VVRSVTIHPFSALFGLALGLVCFIAMSQSSQPADQWPPQKRNIVNIAVTTPVTVPAAGTYVVYRVPSDHWLTITGTYSNGQGGALGGTWWAEEFNGVETLKGSTYPFGPFQYTEPLLRITPASAGGPIGWTFRPGSSVIFKNLSATSALSISEFYAVGYLSRN